MIVNSMNPELRSVGEEPFLSEDFNRRCSINSLSSSVVDLQGQAVAADILVALLDRSAEIRQLVSRNCQFYESLKHYVIETQGERAWQRFQDILYKPREKLPDRVWITRISQFLVHNSVLFCKFKEIVGYTEEIPESVSPPFRLSSSSSSGSSSTTGRRRSRRFSNFDDWPEEENIIEEEAPEVPDGLFTNEEQFYKDSTPRRRRSSCHDLQAEPHPTFVESKIDELDEVEVESDLSDHLSDLLESDDDDLEDNELAKTNFQSQNRLRPTLSKEQKIIRLRDYPDVQQRLCQTHPAYFRKAKQLLSLAPSSRRFSATMRRNSIMEDEIPSSPVIEMDEPRLQTCSDSDEEEEHGSLAHLICTTRRQQPDDLAWYNNVMEALGGWPELVDGLNDILDQVLNTPQ
ncbi:hypothetical protein BY458DRAFT_470504 [Sporodiniella umbellata]|nr:hypothetical protein BY458DRAFT_470504 [Sporodiniella umbellata]